MFRTADEIERLKQINVGLRVHAHSDLLHFYRYPGLSSPMKEALLRNVRESVGFIVQTCVRVV